MATRSSTRRPRASSQARIDTILEAARELLSSEGLANLSIYAIAAKADIPPSSVYHFFPSVSDVLEALIASVHQAFLHALAVLPAAGQIVSWNDLAAHIEQQVLSVYNDDEAARQLILSSHGMSEVMLRDRQHDVELSHAVAALFNHYFKLPPLPADIDIFDLAMQLADRIYTLSIQRHGEITPTMAAEGLRAYQAYLGLYLPPLLQRQSGNTQ
ncbi:TetR/AcrR family transcriptional regulator [Pokkaliibacter sp. MBI-7]|uniref:TetR/AcrR family transcriptional regulator n=1 Tax=Pokkaliibacter sp. MBI-7 TaxID=3040600 RepID=UPI00244851C7|nr:TetR/AcrR family transcriptional regulator [Pokkaliibacter sp. MBI-7]MDH2436007.1 TetR/AcrR family transcriptional regulator [Pokkaliibacter sp. MBI-7]